MKRAWMVLALGMAPAVALACGDYDKSASAPDQMGLAAPPAATKVAAPKSAKATPAKPDKVTIVKATSREADRATTVARN